VVNFGWSIISTVISVANLPADASDAWKAIVSVPELIPYGLTVACLCALAWAIFWPVQVQSSVEEAKADTDKLFRDEVARLTALKRAEAIVGNRHGIATVLGGNIADALAEAEKDRKAEAEARRQRLIHGAAAEAAETQRRRDLIAKGRDLAHDYAEREQEETFREFLESQRVYADIRPHLSVGYRKKLEAVRVAYADADGSKYPSLVAWFLDDLARLEKKWGLK